MRTGLAAALAVWMTFAAHAEKANLWELAVQALEKKDAEEQPEPGGVLFAGSSSIVFWKLDKWFPDAPVLNRGFGGSTVPDVLHFFDRVVTKHEPKKIVFYSGDNDVAKGMAAEDVVKDYTAFLDRVAEELPDTEVLLISVKPSLARWELWPVMEEVNAGLAALADKREKVGYMDMSTVMLLEDGTPDPDIFVRDGLHLNETGYERWTGLVRDFVAAED